MALEEKLLGSLFLTVKERQNLGSLYAYVPFDYTMVSYLTGFSPEELVQLAGLKEKINLQLKFLSTDIFTITMVNATDATPRSRSKNATGRNGRCYQLALSEHAKIHYKTAGALCVPVSEFGMTHEHLNNRYLVRIYKAAGSLICKIDSSWNPRSDDVAETTDAPPVEPIAPAEPISPEPVEMNVVEPCETTADALKRCVKELNDIVANSNGSIMLAVIDHRVRASLLQWIG